MSSPDWDIFIAGAGVGGCAAALAATSLGRKVLMTEETAWIGGQLTSQGVPPDEHPWIETHGRTRRYALFRDRVRAYYRDHYPLTSEAAADPLLNPGQGWVSGLCCEPRVSLAVLRSMLAPAQAAGLLEIRTGWRVVHADVAGDAIASVAIGEIGAGRAETISARYYLDATELGDLLPLAGAEYRTGSESRSRFGERHAPDIDRPDNVQALTWCMAVAFDPSPGADHVIEKPKTYDAWCRYRCSLSPVPWPGELIGLWTTHPYTMQPRRLWIMADSDNDGPDLFTYRRIVSAAALRPGSGAMDVTLVNWPQNDYLPVNIIDKPADIVAGALAEARQLSLSLLYWMQTEAERPGGGNGYPSMMPARDVFGTEDGLAPAPYVRESRRIESVTTITEAHIGAEMLRESGRERAVSFADSVGVGHYRIDLHPTTSGDNYIDIESRSFQIPLGALLPIRLSNLLPACKNIGTTHISNGCYRLHPVEWNIGESAGALAAWCAATGRAPREVREKPALLTEFQELLLSNGVELAWPDDHPG
jgi:hypothetical protein